MPVFSFSSDEKISCFGGALIQSAAPCGANITWTHGETVLVSPASSFIKTAAPSWGNKIGKTKTLLTHGDGSRESFFVWGEFWFRGTVLVSQLGLFWFRRTVPLNQTQKQEAGASIQNQNKVYARKRRKEND